VAIFDLLPARPSGVTCYSWIAHNLDRKEATVK
jgi:hypothetical protein